MHVFETSNNYERHIESLCIRQVHREGGVARASATGPGSPKGALKKFKLVCMKRGESEQAEMGRLKTVKKATVNMNCMGGYSPFRFSMLLRSVR